MAKKGSKFNKYSAEFKIKLVKEYLSCKSGGVDAITKKYGLKSNKQICGWLKIYKNEGPEAFLIEKRGRKSQGRPVSVKLDEMSLEQQVEYLKMENDILKKLKALQKG